MIKINGTPVGDGYPCYIVAEIGINHNGDLAVVKELIDIAAQAGANAVKFQTRTVEVVYTEEELAKTRSVPRTILENAIRRGVLSLEAVRRLQDSNFENSTNGDLKHLLELTEDEYHLIDTYCSQRGISWFTSCWDTLAFERMEKQFNLPCHKIASPCNEDDGLLQHAKAAGKPIILSTGMTDLKGVRDAVNVVGTDNLIILHCTSVYPNKTETGDAILGRINLRGIDTLRETFGVPVGFSSHDDGIQPTYAAAARGAVMLEKHITLNRGLFGSDQGSSVEPIEFARLCRMVKELQVVFGNGVIEIHPEEEVVAKKLRRVRRVK
jgi:N-acetylneuraminate synthase